MPERSRYSTPMQASFAPFHRIQCRFPTKLESHICQNRADMGLPGFHYALQTSREGMGEKSGLGEEPAKEVRIRQVKDFVSPVAEHGM